MTDQLHAKIECTNCTNGEIVFRCRTDNGRVYLACDECLTGYWDLPDRGMAFRTEDAEWESRPATRDEIDAAGWTKYVWF